MIRHRKVLQLLLIQLKTKFNENLTLTWTPTDGNCASDNCVIRFSAPNVTGSMDTYCWAWGGLNKSHMVHRFQLV